MAKILDERGIRENLAKLAGWERIGSEIRRKYSFPDFASALKFVNRVGELAEGMDHHPDIFLHDYKKVTLTLSTHQAEGGGSGLTAMDFELARRIDSI